ncbi:MAG: alpha-ketoglutarate-dependent dioxygenase AlkB family protein [Luteibaculum sp.]
MQKQTNSKDLQPILNFEGEVYLLENYLPLEDYKKLFNALLKGESWQQMPIKLFGKTFLQPRLIRFFAEPGISYSYSKTALKPEEFPSQLAQLKKRIESDFQLRFNCCLGNLYRDGQDSMGLHADNELELGNNPAIASYSLGADRDFVLKHNTQPKQHKIKLKPNSLLLMLGPTQHHWKHALPKRKNVTEARINLTFRYSHPKIAATKKG